MKIKLSITLTSEDLEALAYRIDGHHRLSDAPTGRKATRSEVMSRLERWISDEMSEAHRELESAKMDLEP